ncbi:MAG: MBL fold metallo-hydrolase [bacterium]|nr:MAG: MBL fold metallo-hydrolase [bacterium]
MKIQFWGVRGSIPAPGPATSFFGGNTSCLFLHDDDEPLVILDAGTGIRGLGMELLRNYPNNKDIHLFFSHTHWDHIQGLPFFAPLYIPDYTINIYGPVHYEKTLEEILDRQMEYTYFPVRVAELQAKIKYHELKEGVIKLNGYSVQSKYLNHPVLCLGYKFTKNGKSFVYCTDHEPYYNFLDDEETAEEMNQIVDEQNGRLLDFINRADLLVMDSQYTAKEYSAHVGWGHCSTDYTLDLAIKAGVSRYALFHHDPDRTDEQEKQIIADLLEKKEDSKQPREIFGAREGLTIDI